MPLKDPVDFADVRDLFTKLIKDDKSEQSVRVILDSVSRGVKAANLADRRLSGQASDSVESASSSEDDASSPDGVQVADDSHEGEESEDREGSDEDEEVEDIPVARSSAMKRKAEVVDLTDAPEDASPAKRRTAGQRQPVAAAAATSTPRKATASTSTPQDTKGKLHDLFDRKVSIDGEGKGTPTKGTPTKGTPTKGTPTKGTPKVKPTEAAPKRPTPKKSTPKKATLDVKHESKGLIDIMDGAKKGRSAKGGKSGKKA